MASKGVGFHFVHFHGIKNTNLLLLSKRNSKPTKLFQFFNLNALGDDTILMTVGRCKSIRQLTLTIPKTQGPRPKTTSRSCQSVGHHVYCQCYLKSSSNLFVMSIVILILITSILPILPRIISLDDPFSYKKRPGPYLLTLRWCSVL